MSWLRTHTGRSDAVDIAQQPKFIHAFAELRPNLWDNAAGVRLINSVSATKMNTIQISLSYEELTRTGRDELRRLVEANLLDDATRVRCVHLARFLEKVSQMAGPMASSTAVRDVLSEDELQKIWRETADEGSPLAVEQRPLFH